MTKDNKGKTFVMTNQSPYFLHPSDSHGAITTTIKFNGRNYDLWERAVTTSLKSKNKLGFMDGSITKLETKYGIVSNEEGHWRW